MLVSCTAGIMLSSGKFLPFSEIPEVDECPKKHLKECENENI
jgi:hypothetical protein